VLRAIQPDAVHVVEAGGDHLEVLHVLGEDLLLVGMQHDGDRRVLDDGFDGVVVEFLALLVVGLRARRLDGAVEVLADPFAGVPGLGGVQLGVDGLVGVEVGVPLKVHEVPLLFLQPAAPEGR